MVTERTIINILIVGAALILAPFVISSSLEIDSLPALFFGGMTAVIFAFFYLKDSLCLCPMLGTYILGALNFLPLPLQAKHIACIMLILYYITGYVIIRQKKIKLGRPQLLWPILMVTGVVLDHNHTLSFGALGGSSEGAKPAFLIYLVVIGYFCSINMATPSVRFLSWIPLLTVILSLASSFPFFLSTFIPSLAPALYAITNSVNTEAYFSSLDGDSGGVNFGTRLAALGPVGSSLQLYLLCKYPIGSWIRPERWWVLGLSVFCALLAVTSGYRNVLFSFAMITMIAAWINYSWRSLFLPAGALIFLILFIIASSNNLINLPVKSLPVIAQRTLSFLPADWDADAVESAASSNQFRKSIQDVYIREYMWRNPLLGNGFSIDTAQFDFYSAAMSTAQTQPDREYDQSKTFIEGKLFHTGWLSLYDIVGLVGSIGFIALGVNEVIMVYGFLFGPKADRRSTLYPLYFWLFCNITTTLISFFTVFGDFGTTFPDLCIYGMVLSHLYDIESTREIPIVLGERKKSLEFADAKAGQYGYGGYSRY